MDRKVKLIFFSIVCSFLGIVFLFYTSTLKNSPTLAFFGIIFGIILLILGAYLMKKVIWTALFEGVKKSIEEAKAAQKKGLS